MRVDEVAALFKQYISEPTNSFMSTADVALYLKLSHNLIRSDVATWRPNLLNKSVGIIASGTSYDLADPVNAVRLMGTSPTHDELLSISSVWTSDGLGTAIARLKSAPSRGALESSSMSYFLEGSALRFGASVSSALQIVYVPYANVDWTKQTPGDNEFIDDFISFHDLIALEAAKKFMIRDGAVNPALMAEYDARKAAFDVFLTMAGDAEAYRAVEVPGDTYWD